jgi:hypothetical protein
MEHVVETHFSEKNSQFTECAALLKGTSLTAEVVGEAPSRSFWGLRWIFQRLR